jgi:CubicO group peptidase (beta-lactamase class C family)
MRNALLFLLLVVACTAAAQQDPLAAIADSVQKQADADQFSGVLLIARDGKPVLQRAWGLANKESKTPNTMDTKFNIGSINKAFTKKAIEQLAAAGKLSLDDRIRKYLPDFPSPAADKITIRQLLDHRSGLGDFFGPKYNAAPPSKLRELRDFLPLFADQPLKFEPGTGQSYSNAGYVTLGLIIESITGEKYRDYVAKNIFAPAGMNNSGFWAIDEKVPNRVTGYTMRGPDGPLTERRTNENSLPGRPSSAGGAYTTAGDLLRFFQWLKVPGIGVAGGAPGLNAAAEVNDAWTVMAMSNYDPPAAEEVAQNAMRMLAPPRRAPSAPDKTTIEGLVSVPLTPSNHLMAVEAKINGKGRTSLRSIPAPAA